MEFNYWVIGAGFLFVLNVLVCFYISRRDGFDKKQKYIQCLLVLLIPFIGAIGIYFIVRALSEPFSKPKKSFGGGPNDSGYVSSGGGSENS